MNFDPKFLINIGLAILALVYYFIGSFRFYQNKKGFRFFLGLALLTDVITATLASCKITPTTQIPGTVAVPWDSFLFKIHVVLSTLGITGFLVLFIYLLVCKPSNYKSWIRKWQFLGLLPIWITGEMIALINALFKLFLRVRLFELI
jgi:hypothetical protein